MTKSRRIVCGLILLGSWMLSPLSLPARDTECGCRDTFEGHRLIASTCNWRVIGPNLFQLEGRRCYYQ